MLETPVQYNGCATARAAWEAAQREHTQMLEAIRYGRSYSAEQISDVCRRFDQARTDWQQLDDGAAG